MRENRINYDVAAKLKAWAEVNRMEMGYNE